MNIIIIQRELPSNVSAFTHDNLDGSYTVIINMNISREKQINAVLHEIAHIKSDDFYTDYSVSLLEHLMHQKEEKLSLDLIKDINFFYMT